MAATWAELSESGRGRIILLLEVFGLERPLSTHDYLPTDSWFTSAGYKRPRPWLKFEGVTLDERCSFTEGSLDVKGLTLKVADIDGEFTALMKGWRARSFTRLKETITATTLSFNVWDGDALSADGGVLWIGQEAILYTGVSTDTVTVHASGRGYYGTEARAYEYDADADPMKAPTVTDGPHTLGGRPCRIHAAVMDESDDTPGATTTIYRGFIGYGMKAGQGEWSIPIDHASTVFGRRVAQGLPESKIEPYQYWYDAVTGATAFEARLGYIVIEELDYSGAVVDPDFYFIEITGGHYTSTTGLANDITEKIQAEGLVIDVRVVVDAEDPEKFAITAAAAADYSYWIHVREHDPLWALGFKTGPYPTERNVAYEQTADDKPRLLVYEFPRTGSAAQATINVSDGGVFTADEYVAPPENTWRKVASIASNQLTLAAWPRDSRHDDARWVIEDDEDCKLAHVLMLADYGTSLDGDDLTGVAKKMLDLYTNGSPWEWLAAGLISRTVSGVDMSDVDWSELDDALVGVPNALRISGLALRESTEVREVLCPRLGLLGIAPRITTDGKIGFARVQTPSLSQAASVEVDDEVWSLLEAAEVQSYAEGEPLLNQVRVAHSWDYTTGKWAPEAKFEFYDGLVELGRRRAMTYKAYGLNVGDGTPLRDAEALAAELAPRLLGTHFGPYARAAPIVEVPCTWLSRQLYCGDIVKLTHPCVVDVAQGTVGTTERLGIIVGRQLQVTEDRPDVLLIQLPLELGAAGIAPCALSTGWTAGTLTLAFGANPNDYCQSGATDLDHFSVGDECMFIEYNASAGTTWGAATLASVNTSTGNVVLASDPFGGAYPATNVWMIWRDWDNATSAQQDWAYIADTASPPTLGAGGDDMKTWGI